MVYPANFFLIPCNCQILNSAYNQLQMLVPAGLALVYVGPVARTASPVGCGKVPAGAVPCPGHSGP